MEIVVLDVKGTHVRNPDCKMRLMYHTANQHWYCVDCGLVIIHTRVSVMDEAQFNARIEELKTCAHTLVARAKSNEQSN